MYAQTRLGRPNLPPRPEYLIEDLISGADGLTASASQTQVGGTPITTDRANFTTVGTAGDSATLDAAIPGKTRLVFNNGANAMAVFPASGEDLGAGTDTSVSVAAGSMGIFYSITAGEWIQDTAGGGLSYSSGGSTVNVLPKNDGSGGLEDSGITETSTVLDWTPSGGFSGLSVTVGGSSVTYTHAWPRNTVWSGPIGRISGVGAGGYRYHTIYPGYGHSFHDDASDCPHNNITMAEFYEADGKPQVGGFYDASNYFTVEADSGGDTELLASGDYLYLTTAGGSTSTRRIYFFDPAGGMYANIVSSYMSWHVGSGGHQWYLSGSSLFFANGDGLTLSGTRFLQHSQTTGITASTTQTQGQQPLTRGHNVIATCATANDTVTMPSCVAGRDLSIANNGAETLQVFPASGDSIDGGSVDASITIASGSRALFRGDDGTNWTQLI